ncbi:MAG: S41 family peptidase [Rikenellaceae bacterium]
MKKILLVIALGVVSLYSSAKTPPTQKDAEKQHQLEVAQNIESLLYVFRSINLFYVDTVSPSKLMQSAARSMFRSLDPYSEYISKEEMEDFEFSTTGKYGGVGSLIRQRGEWVEIAEPYKGSPSDLSGLKAGDRLVSIDNETLQSIGSAAVSNKLKGDPGTTFQLVYRPLRDTTTLDTVMITREKISIPAVPYYGIIRDSIGYINFSSFTKDGATEVHAAFNAMKQSAEMNSLILDLRDNGGGVVDEAIEILSLFLPKNSEVLSIIGKIEESNKDFSTIYSPEDLDIPIVVLVNNMSASASEIVAGALQDLDRAVIIGERSFGKGLVQTTRAAPYGGMVKITTGKYYTPSGRCIQALDYTHRQEDGSVGHIPDSLIQEFTTVNGRKVYSGGGIIPDIKVELESYSNFTKLMVFYSFIDDFANLWAAHNSPSKEEFELSDELYQEFVDFMQDKEIKYESYSAIKLKELRDAAAEEKYDSLIIQELDLIAQKISNDKNQELQRNKTDIKEMLKYALLNRLFYKEYAIEKSTEVDPYINAAVEVLSNPSEYQRILTEQDTQKN